VPRGQRFDDKQSVADSLIVWRGLDPQAAWNAPLYSPQSPASTVSQANIRTEELSTAASDKTSLAALRAPGSMFANWKMAEFMVGEARQAGYIAMRDPVNTRDVVFYDRANPNDRASKGIAKALARIARIV
jgi:hypothetical protein